MNIHHIRNATCVIETADHRILVDPMLGCKGELPPFSFFRFKAKRNPIVDLPPEADRVLDGVDHCLITHSQTFGIRALQHSDHLDSKGEDFLIKNDIPVICRSADAAYLKKYGLQVEAALELGKKYPFGGGKINTIAAQHGHGWNHHLMANGVGYFIDLPDEPSLYISGDTVYTNDIQQALEEHRPEVSVVAAGRAQLDIGPPILMSLEEVISFTQKAPGKVVMNHLEALNHCPTTRNQLQDALNQHGLLEKAFIPADGETLAFEKNN